MMKILGMVLSSFYFFLLCWLAFCAAAVNRVWLPFWLLLLLLVVPSTFVTDSVCFILKWDVSPVSLSDMMEENLLKTFLTIKKLLGAVSRTSAQFTNEVRKRTRELGSTHLGKLGLGEFSIRSRNFYEIKLGILEFLDSECKSWTLDTGRWSLDTGLWTLHAGLWMMNPGLWTLDARFWMLDPGCWTLDSGLWMLESGPWTLNATL